MKQKIIEICKKKKIFIPILIYLLLLPGIFYIYSGSTPKEEVEIYKGIWMPTSCLSPTLQSMAFDFSRMKDDGMNTVQFGPIHYSIGGKIYPTPWDKALTIAYIQSAHRKGLKVFLNLDLYYITKPQQFFATSPTVPEEAFKEIQEQYESFVVEWAEIAEKYEVELFSPMNEPEIKFGCGASSGWGQQIISKIKEVYHGEVVWRGVNCGEVIWNPESHDHGGQWKDCDVGVNFSGYDYVGFTICPDAELKEYPQSVNDNIKTAAAFAKRDGAKGFMITEFWVPSPREGEGYHYTIEEKAKAQEIVLQTARDAEDKAAGLFVCDAPAGWGPSFKGTIIEKVVKKYFLEEYD